MKVFLYIRVACADQLAAADQREELERYAKDKGYEALGLNLFCVWVECAASLS